MGFLSNKIWVRIFLGHPGISLCRWRNSVTASVEELRCSFATSCFRALAKVTKAISLTFNVLLRVVITFWWFFKYSKQIVIVADGILVIRNKNIILSASAAIVCTAASLSACCKRKNITCRLLLFLLLVPVCSEATSGHALKLLFRRLTATFWKRQQAK